MSASGPRISTLLLGANLFVLASLLAAPLGLRVYDTYLVRQTERQLIAQAVVIGEAWRELLRAERSDAPQAADVSPPGREADRFVPIEPVIDLAYGIAPPQPEVTRLAPGGDTAERRAGARLAPMLERMQRFNLSAVRVLDASGCVVATTRGEGDRCLDELPEVRAALDGRYQAVARERISDEPLPPIADVRSRGSIRVFSALPIFEAGKVLGVVRVSRTSLDALTSLWYSRRGLVVALGVTLLFALLSSLGFAAMIAWPVRRITRSAQNVALGGQALEPGSSWVTPREIAELDVALATMTRTLRERAEYVEDFATQVSHELKTPITAIRGAAELLRDSWAGMTPEQRDRFVSNIDADAERMERLVMRLLALARIEHATEVPGNVAVRPFFTDLVQRYPSVKLSWQDPPDQVAIHPDHLVSAIANLVDNAVRHGRDEPVDLEVGREGARLRVVVRDRGAGISPLNQPKIFSRFFTTERDHGGTGLGLSLVRAIAERRGGSVSFVTGPSGTSFTLLL